MAHWRSLQSRKPSESDERAAHELAASNVCNTIRRGGLKRLPDPRFVGGDGPQAAEYREQRDWRRTVSRANLEASLTGLVFARSAGLGVVEREILTHIERQWGVRMHGLSVAMTKIGIAAQWVENQWRREPWKATA